MNLWLFFYNSPTRNPLEKLNFAAGSNTLHYERTEIESFSGNPFR